jgi:hypothetical protein
MHPRMRRILLIGLVGAIAWLGTTYFLNKNLTSSIVGGLSWLIVTVLLSLFFPKDKSH